MSDLCWEDFDCPGTRVILDPEGFPFNKRPRGTVVSIGFDAPTPYVKVLFDGEHENTCWSPHSLVIVNPLPELPEPTAYEPLKDYIILPEFFNAFDEPISPFDGPRYSRDAAIDEAIKSAEDTGEKFFVLEIVQTIIPTTVHDGFVGPTYTRK